MRLVRLVDLRLKAGRALLALVVVAFLIPILYLFSIALRTSSDALNGSFLPTHVIWNNWSAAFHTIPLALFLRNSLLAAVVGALGSVAIGLLAAYANVRHGVGGGMLPAAILASYVAPPVVALIPLFLLFRDLHLLNSVPGLAIAYALMNVPVALWLTDGFVRRVPIEIEEAARLDGLGSWRLLWSIVLPLISPGVIAALIICFILSYNEFLFAVSFAQSTATQTVTVGISLFQGSRHVQYGQEAAASLIAIAPVYLLALLLQRFVIGGLSTAAIK